MLGSLFFRQRPGSRVTLLDGHRLLMTFTAAAALTFAHNDAIGADIAQLSVGDPSPRFTLQVIQPGKADAEAALFPEAFLERAPFLVVTYWSTWCPGCRATIALDETEKSNKQLLRIAVSPEDRERLRGFTEDAGWRGHVVAADSDRAAYRSLLLGSKESEADEPVLPYTCIIGSPARASRALASPDPRTEPVLLWCGRTATPEIENPRAEYQRVCAQIVDGRFDVREERKAQEERRLCATQLDDFARSVTNDDVARVETTLAELESCAAPSSRSRAVVAFMNEFAWNWATRDGRTDAHLEMAERMCRLAMKHGGERDAYFLDTYAKVLQQRGRLDEAIEMQRTAVGLLDPGPAEELRATLDGYLVEAGLPPTAGTALATESDRWNRNLNAVWDAAPAAEIVIVHPEGEAWAKEAKTLQDRFLTGSTIRTPETLREAERRKVLILYGTPAQNPVTKEVLDRHGIAMTPAGVQVGSRLLEQARPVLITAVPNPWNESLPVAVYTALEESDAHNANRVFHGPTSLVIGTWDNGAPTSVYTLDYVPDSSPLEPRIGEMLTSAQARSDLEALSRSLQSSYAGFPDLEWNVSKSGSTWAERDQQFVRRLEKAPGISWNAFYSLVREYLSGVQDTHFSLRGTGVENGRVITRTDRLVETLVPYFADAQVRVEGNRLTIAAADSTLNGVEPLDVERISTPHAVRPREPYLFPTLPIPFPRQRATEPPSQFLIGVLGDPLDPPATMRVRVRDRSGRSTAMDLPVHRGRVPFTESEGAWRVRGAAGSDAASSATSLVILSVRSMVMNQLHGMAETAGMLRKKEGVILDLRGNTGGGDQPAMQWCQEFSGQPYEWIAAVVRLPGAWNPLQSTLSIAGRSRESLLGQEYPHAEAPYPGRLFVLWDHRTASSGETFSHLAAQVNQAVSVGENSAGCVSYGNLEQHVLPESGIELTFGRSRFVVDWVRPVAEGIGMFPDYWLDTDDPIGHLERALQSE